MVSAQNCAAAPTAGARRSLPLAGALLWVGSLITAGTAAADLVRVERFDRLSVDDGLSQSWVYSILQDRRGFLWFGTEHGLNRYDGYRFQQYKPRRGDPGSLADGKVYALLEDRRGELWVGTVEGGLHRLDRESDTFVRYPFGPGESGALSDPFVNALLEDRDGNLWVATYGGLDLLDRDTGRAHPHRHDPSEPESLPDDRVRALLEDREGRLWVGTESGLALLDRQRGAFVPHVFARGTLVAGENAAVKALHQDRQGDLWVGTRDGLFRYRPGRGPLGALRHDPRDPGSLPDDNIWQISEDEDGRLWVATHGGLARLDLRHDSLEVFRHGPQMPHSIGHDRVKALHLDRSGLLWAGTLGGGLSIWNPRAAAFATYRHSVDRPAGVDGDDVHAVLEDQEGVLWLGGGSGLAAYERGNGSWRRKSWAPDALGAGLEARVRGLVEDSEGRLWVGSSSGLMRLDRRSGHGGVVLPGEVGALALDGQGALWAATPRGAARIDTADSRVRVYRHDPEDPGSLSHDEVLSLLMGPDGRLWLGTRTGLNRFDPELDRFERYVVGEDRTGHQGILALLGLRDGELWLGTDGHGLWRLQWQGGPEPSVSRWTVQDGLPSDTVTGLLADGSGRLWISSAEGLSRFDLASGTFKHFLESDGLQGNEFHPGAAYRSAAGELFFGGSRGLTAFRPEAVMDNPHPPPVAITALTIGNQRIAPGRLVPGVPIPVPYDQAVVAVEFAGLDFARPRLNRYRYRLIGLDDRWQEAGSRREVIFSHLEPGPYRLEVIASHGDGVWSQLPATVELHVPAAPWRTRWAYAGYLLTVAIVAAGLGASRARKRRERRAAEAAVRVSEQRLQLALWGSGHGLWDWQGRSGQIFRSNFGETLGYSGGELDNDLVAQRELVHEEDLPRLAAAWEDHLSGASPYYDVQYRIRAQDRRWVWIHERGKAVERGRDGRALRVAGTHSDITEQKTIQDEVRLLAKAFESTSEAMVITDGEGRILEVNRAFTAICGYDTAEVVGKPIELLRSSRHSEGFYARVWEHLRETGQWQGEIWQSRKSGEELPVFLNIAALHDEQGVVSHYVAMFSDTTERRRAEEELRRLASFDLLTRLPNRTLFEDRLAHAVANAERAGKRLALLLIDLDRFKQVNDSLGHAAGDLLLQAVAGRLQECVRTTDTVARLGGDEFTVLLEDVAGEPAVGRVAEEIVTVLGRPVTLGGREITITPSIGISLYPGGGATSAALLRNADIAMYHAKAQGRNHHQFFAPEMNTRAVELLTLENELRRAVEHGELLLHFQPRVELASGRISSIEALVRWQHPQRGLMRPDTFVPIAEDSGIILGVGEWVLRAACRQAVAWQRAGIDMRVAVNLSPRQFGQRDLAGTVASVLADTGLPGSLLELEITETTIMSSLGQAREMLQRLKDMGLYLSVDDFGTGYSSLSYLKAFPIDALKIDRSFVRDMTTDVQDAAIVSAIATLARSLGLAVIGEGVETWEQLVRLREEGCQEVQGFLLSAPRPAAELEQILRAGWLALLPPPSPSGHSIAG